jgi:hypothetical protein
MTVPKLILQLLLILPLPKCLWRICRPDSAEPTDLRIFFFDPIKFAPKLLDDYIPPKNLMGGFLDKYPSMFLEVKVL